MICPKLHREKIVDLITRMVRGGGATASGDPVYTPG